MEEPLYFRFQDQVVDLFLQYNVAIIGACVFGYFLLQFKEEYFPKKARGYDVALALQYLSIRRKSLWQTSKSSKS